MDSVRCLVRETARACGAVGVPGWRQWRHHRRKFMRLYCQVSGWKRRKSSPEDVRAQLAASRKISDKAQASLAMLRTGGNCPDSALDEIDRLLLSMPK